ncbi:MAG: beta-lactamase family protein, partial [Parvularculaceae bacterium]|nr:beta-lactamase family protein [Parvularculaceae bacterium]
PSHAYDNLLEQGLAPETILARYPQLKLVCPVGACYGYQNIAFDLAGNVLVDAYKKPYAELLGEKLFTPLGMATASVGLDALDASGDWARPHRRTKIGKARYAFGPWRVGRVTPYYYAVPAAGGVNASILDLSLWLKAQMGYAPLTLSPAALELMQRQRTGTPAETVRMKKVSERFEDTGYGLGWRIYRYAGQKVIAHGGTLDGYASQIAFLPDRDVGIVLLSNAQSRRFWRLLPSFLDIELGLPRGDYLDLAPLLAGRPDGPIEDEDDENEPEDGSSG